MGLDEYLGQRPTMAASQGYYAPLAPSQASFGLQTRVSPFRETDADECNRSSVGADKLCLPKARINLQ